MHGFVDTPKKTCTVCRSQAGKMARLTANFLTENGPPDRMLRTANETVAFAGHRSAGRYEYGQRG